MPLPEKCRNLLTICRKAGKLEAGFARAKDAIQGGYAACILLTADPFRKSRKEVLYFSGKTTRPSRTDELGNGRSPAAVRTACRHPDHL